MKIFLFVIGIMCRRINLEPKGTFTFRDKVASGAPYSLSFQASRGDKGSQKSLITVLDPTGKQMVASKDPYSVYHFRMKHAGEVTVSVKNNSSKEMPFVYRRIEHINQTQNNSGPINNELVSELQNVLETIIQTQRAHIKKHEEHGMMVAKSRRRITLLLVFETVFFTSVLLFLHKRMLKMFESKRDV
ncbi:hypothetical protein CWI42_030750 [Ordospora colligata]|uniref:GOLD domain-containing protein n=1 Tax=Ordospora colligata OC4 TaxID=1354746 RepID=A0A0B2UM54_9MICR|nr:uncharacterized protein M896_030460 [Ordospora colligata OC4]KHN70060.1 hypothetical protein M896_030460 [Ordospora colligata OC4]TBU16442.1 hypothetical protein CWI41_030420 [Ordospora colligata]TBU16627.1 hypothetical protein CWI40_030820 [Ordospora colligata]TBU19200.1 hypothetical protein CWI42_030750 [Ordospora colligata]